MEEGPRLTVHRHDAVSASRMGKDLPNHAPVRLCGSRKKDAAYIHKREYILQYRQLTGQRPVGKHAGIERYQQSVIPLRETLRLELYPEKDGLTVRFYLAPG